MADLHSDGDDAPEQITLTSGREEAEKLWKEEKEEKKRVAAIAKGRHKLRSNKKVEEAVPDGAPEPSGKEGEVPEKVNRPQKRRHVDGVDGARQTEKAAPGSVMLDDNIVQFLTVQEHQIAKDESQAQRKPIKEKKSKKTFNQQLDIETDSRTKIVLLKAEPPSAAAKKALEFRREQLFGQHLRRSAAMLPLSSKPFLASV